MSDLELGVIGNCAVAALINRDACVVWYCLPRFDGDPVFHTLLGAPRDAPDGWHVRNRIGTITFKATNVTSPIQWCSRQSCTESMVGSGFHGFRSPFPLARPHISSADPGAPANSRFRAVHASGFALARVSSCGATAPVPTLMDHTISAMLDRTRPCG